MTFTADQLLDAQAVATQYIQENIPDVMTKANYAFNMFMNNKSYKSGGTKIQFPLNHKELESQGFINGTTDVLSTNPQQTFTYGELEWKYFYDTVAVTLDDLTKTQDTPKAIVDLFMAKAQAALNSVARKLSTAVHTSGTAANKQWNGLPDIFAASGTAYAGQTDTNFDTADAWLTEIDSSTQIVNYKNISKMIDKLRQRCQGLYNQTTGKKYNIDIAFSNYAVRNEYSASEQNKARYVSQETLKSGFDVININGVKWAIDGYTPGSADGSTADNYLYIVSSGSMMLFYKYGIDKPCPMDSKAERIPNQPIQFNVNFLSGNMACENRRVNGVFKTLVA